MTDVRCPGCGLHISEAAVARGSCPCCDYSFQEPPAVEPILPVEVTTLPQPVLTPEVAPSRRVLPLIALGIGCFAIGAWWTIHEPSQPNPVAKVEPQPLPPLVQPLPQEPVSTDELGPLPREVVEVVVPIVPVVVAEPAKVVAEPAKVDVIDPFDVAEKNWNDPAGVAQVLDLEGDRQLVLTGRIKTLRIGAIHGSSQFDASGLEADEIIITGDIDGSTVVKLAARSKIRLSGIVGGGSTLTIHSPEGSVIFAGEQACLTAGAKIAVNAKNLDIQSHMDGGVRMDVILSSGGYIKTAVMDGGATVRYQSTDSEPMIETGELRGGAKVERAK